MPFFDGKDQDESEEEENQPESDTRDGCAPCGTLGQNIGCADRLNRHGMM